MSSVWSFTGWYVLDRPPNHKDCTPPKVEEHSPESFLYITKQDSCFREPDVALF